jgi:hypothetical protein
MDTRDSIELVVNDWCELTGWTMKRTLDRIDVVPPPSLQEDKS